ncbi:YeeE/YedE family protein [Zobellella iuensis]|uniref:YeeE/YedE family protein n=1 Tax=Zobellella iuensis TaxID=2803811 RepID=A0ABS1QQK5_9GAMM|nr:YeeE/YedE family protein [Zobellella iuensis]MBL1376529.1 YeeE/YedE family protein [Zobellella iuensis]
MPAPAPARRPAIALALLVLLALLLAGRALADGSTTGNNLAFSLLAGALFGLVLQRSRFCFFCISRDFVERRDARGLLGLVVALAVGSLGYQVLFGAFLLDPTLGRLPPGAHIGPVSWVLAAGAFTFGIGMALSGSCLSAHLYRLGEGSLAAPFALLGALGGFVLGFLSWNPLYLRVMQEAPVIWLPARLGYGGALLLQLLLLATLALALVRAHRPPAESGPPPAGSLHGLLFGRRWPTYVGGILVGMIGVMAYFRVAPLGVTAELGSLARTGADGLGLLPGRLEGLDGFSGCITVVKEHLLSDNGLFVLGLVGASLASALVAGDWRPRRPAPGEVVRCLAGGLLMGWGAMVALGCTVGTLLSGVMAGALSGWVFLLCCPAGILAGLWLRRRLPG